MDLTPAAGAYLRSVNDAVRAFLMETDEQLTETEAGILNLLLTVAQQTAAALSARD